MIEGFDKEIDALLRQTAKSEIASANTNFQSKIQNPKSEIHLDADEIAAFAENAVSEKIKANYTAHFADCDRCRTILANIIALNSEAETVAASSIVAPQTVETTSIPWHRRFFAFPNLAFAMGALVVLFGGFIAFNVVRNVNQASNSADLSQIAETEQRAGGPSFEGEPNLTVSNSASSAMSNATSANTANTVSNMMMSNAAATINTANASTNTPSRTANANAAAAQMPRPTAPPPAIAQAAPPSAETFSTDAAGSSVARISENEKKSADQRTSAEKTETARAESRSDSADLSARNTTPTTGNNSDSPKAKVLRKQTSGEESRQIGGKTFARKDGVWYDANYNGQATTNIARGSDDYKKLDSSLRSIADNLGGTVVIVWKNKAYRIQ